ncbi:hypothetical protein D3C73_1660770 [compost metagenome]
MEKGDELGRKMRQEVEILVLEHGGAAQHPEIGFAGDDGIIGAAFGMQPGNGDLH